MKILVTGATGFIGKNLVEGLIKKRDNISCLVRKKSNKEDILFLKRLGCKIVYGDITRDINLKKMMGGCDAVYHLAGILGGQKVPDKKYYNINVKGTKSLIDSCNGQKFIFCSSAGVLGPVINGDEKSRISPTNIYEDTKAEAEKIVRRYNNYVILRPEFVYGPFDKHVLKLFISVKTRRFRIVGDGKSHLHPTYIDDLTYCLIKCLDKQIKNEIFVVAGEKPVSVNNFLKLVSDRLNAKPNRIKVPLIFAKYYVKATEPISKRLNINPILTKSSLDFFTKSRTFNTDKAKKMLGFKPVKLESGIKKTIEWYKRNGYL